jgi:hypothetical protein
LSKRDIIKIKMLFERIQEQELQLEQQEEYLIGKIEELKALNEEHEKLKHSHTSLIGKHEKLEKKYASATIVSSCVVPLEKECLRFLHQQIIGWSRSCVPVLRWSHEHLALSGLSKFRPLLKGNSPTSS